VEPSALSDARARHHHAADQHRGSERCCAGLNELATMNYQRVGLVTPRPISEATDARPSAHAMSGYSVRSAAWRTGDPRRHRVELLCRLTGEDRMTSQARPRWKRPTEVDRRRMNPRDSRHARPRVDTHNIDSPGMYQKISASPLDSRPASHSNEDRSFIRGSYAQDEKNHCYALRPYAL